MGIPFLRRDSAHEVQSVSQQKSDDRRVRLFDKRLAGFSPKCASMARRKACSKFMFKQFIRETAGAAKGHA